MPRMARIVLADMPHHITQRGNNRQDVFFVDEDRRAYLKFLGDQCSRQHVALLGYCLMTNHVHLIAIPKRPDSMAKAIGRTHWLYAQYINRLHGRSGHLWQNRFYSNAMDDDHCLTAMRYIERNPIRAGICRVASRYAWSSAAAHCDEASEPSGLDVVRWKELLGKTEWKEQLSIDIADKEYSSLRRSIHTGRPSGSDSFISKIEGVLGRRIRPQVVGRPKKPKWKNKLERSERAGKSAKPTTR